VERRWITDLVERRRYDKLVIDTAGGAARAPLIGSTAGLGRAAVENPAFVYGLLINAGGPWAML